MPLAWILAVTGTLGVPGLPGTGEALAEGLSMSARSSG